jgi:ComEC/Rec2-related protein
MESHQRSGAKPSLVSYAAITFLAGVLIHAAFPFVQTPHGLVVGLSIASVVSLFIPHRIRWVAAAIFIGILSGLWRFDVTLPRAILPETPFEGTVVEAGRYDVLVKDHASGVKVKIAKRLRVGDHVRVSCNNIEPLQPSERAQFDARKGAWFSCKGNVAVSRLSQGQSWDLRRVLGAWRTVLTRRIQTILPGDAGALLAGILYGERGLSADASDAFKTAGMTHLIAVSGSNIAIVISLFVPFFLFLGYRRQTAIVLAGGAITLFVVFVGAQSSVVRAAFMGWLALLARVFGRKASAGRLLIIAATTIVIFDPWALAFDAGFALSFLATAGLLYWSGPFQERLKWMPSIGGIREAAATTLAATIATFPYSMWAFGGASLAGLLTNLFAVPIGGLAMMWGAVAVAFGPFIPFSEMPARGCLEAMLGIARLSELAPWLKVAWTLPTWGLFMTYGMIAAVFIQHRAKNKRYPQEHAAELEISPLLRRAVRDR